VANEVAPEQGFRRPFEINEAFPVVARAAKRDLVLPHDKINVDGGTCALGHPTAPRARAFR